jgi:hypothetical protein
LKNFIKNWICVLLLIAQMPIMLLAQRPAVNRPTPSRSAPSRQMPSKQMPSKSGLGNKVGNNSASDRKANISNSGNKINNSGNKTNNFGSGNKKTNIDNSRKNINIDNSTNVNIGSNNRGNNVVRRNNFRPYPRPPYVYGGFRYRCYNPFFYHPYTPFFWGPVWHPWGFFVAALATTAIIVSIENQQYHYDQGVYYVQSNGGYTVVQAPVGATITTLPPKSETVIVNETVNNYYYGGTFYEKGEKGYTVVPPTAGTIVEHLPEGGKEVKLGDITYVKVGDIYYQPIQKDGKNMYEVVDVEEDDKK